MSDTIRMVVLDGHTMGQGDNPWDAIAAQGELAIYDRTPAGLIVERAKGAQVLFTNKTPITAETIAQLPDLRCVCVLATGYNVVDTAAAAARGIPVCNVPGYSTQSVAQHVMAVTLELFTKASRHARAVAAGKWAQTPDFCFWDQPIAELCGKTMGIVGFGGIGQRVGELAHAFGMRVLAYNPRPKAVPGYEPFAFASLPELFSQADVVSLHCPLTPENTGLVGGSLLASMKPSAFLVNTARGPLVDEAALISSLRYGMLAGAALDVVCVEPMRDDDPLLTAPNCIITPHVAWASVESRRKLMAESAENLRAFLSGKPRNVVNGV